MGFLIEEPCVFCFYDHPCLFLQGGRIVRVSSEPSWENRAELKIHCEFICENKAWIPTLWRRPSWRITTRPSTQPGPTFTLFIRMLPCWRSRARSFRELRISKTRYQVCPFSNANTPSTPWTANRLVLLVVCLCSLVEACNSPIRSIFWSLARWAKMWVWRFGGSSCTRSRIVTSIWSCFRVADRRCFIWCLRHKGASMFTTTSSGSTTVEQHTWEAAVFCSRYREG